MDYYPIESVVEGAPTLIDVANKMALNIERIIDYRGFYAASYRCVETSISVRQNDSTILRFEPTAVISKLFETTESMDKQRFDRFIVPKGALYAKVCTTTLQEGTAGISNSTKNFNAQILKNGSASYLGSPKHRIVETYDDFGVEEYIALQTPWLSVRAGDFFQLRITSSESESIEIPNIYNFSYWSMSVEFRK